MCRRASYSYCACSLCQQTNPLRKNIFHQVENVIKQLVHTSSVRSFQTSHVLHISMNAHWSVNQLLITRLQCKLFPFNSDLVKLYNLIHFFSLDLGLPVYCVVMESLVKNITLVLHYSHVWLVLQWVFQDVPHSCLIKNNNMIFFQT